MKKNYRKHHPRVTQDMIDRAKEEYFKRGGKVTTIELSDSGQKALIKLADAAREFTKIE